MTPPTWHSDEPPNLPTITALGYLRVALRGFFMAVILGLGVLTSSLVRLPEGLIHGSARPWTSRITVAVCRLVLRALGLSRTEKGTPMSTPGIFAANHSSWLDIFILNAGAPLIFVSKAEVAGWPGIGLLAKITGTVFVRRNRTEASAQKDIFETRLTSGQRLLFFPEGTSTDGRRVLPFKPTLFAALFSDPLHQTQYVQPVSVVYTAPKDRDPRFYGWWGDMDFGPHLLHMLAEPRHGTVALIWHPPLKVSDFESRKTLSAAAETAVRSGHSA